MPTDAERLDFLAEPATFVQPRKCDMWRSDLPEGKNVCFMRNGVIYDADGETLRDAVDAAMQRAAAVDCEGTKP